MLTASVLERARESAESLMTDECTVVCPGESVTDPNTGEVKPTSTQVYVGHCKVQTSGGLASENVEGSAAQAMGAASLVWSLYIHFPFGTMLRNGDLVTVTNSANPELVGRRYRMISPPVGEVVGDGLPVEREGGRMSGLFDASQLTAFGDALLAKGVARRALISASVTKGAQNVKNSIRDDLKGSGNKAFRRIPISYTLQESAGRITAEIGPTKGGAGSLANIAFFGTARGGGTHRFYEHGEEELPKLAEYVARAAVEGF